MTEEARIQALANRREVIARFAALTDKGILSTSPAFATVMAQEIDRCERAQHADRVAAAHIL